MLEQLEKDLWTVSIPHKFMGLHFGTRMTIVCQKNKNLILHSPIHLTDELKGELEQLGSVQHIIAPNLFHHLYVGEYVQEYSNARIHGAVGLANKRSDLSFHTELGSQSQDEWEGDLDQVMIEGMPKLNETAFFHRSSRTLICCDLVQNIQNVQNLWTKLYLKINRINNRVGVSKIIKLTFQDRTMARKSLDQILTWDFGKIVMSHGEIIQSNGNKILKEIYEWL